MGPERTLKTSRGIVTYSIYDFIKEIGSRPVIWDKEHINRTNRFMAWHDVVRSFVPYFDELSIEEQNDLYLDLNRNWKNITNILMKTIKMRNSGDPKCRPYRYAHYMEFYLNNRGITLDEVGTAEEFKEIDEMERKRCEKFNFLKAKGKKQAVENNINLEQSGSNINECQDSTFDPSIFCESSVPAGFNSEQPNGEAIKQNYSYDGNVYYSSTEDIEDADQDFFDSIKPVLVKLNGAQMLDFKIEFLEILKKYKLQNV